MNKKTGFFRRIGPPVILTIGRSNQLVKTGDVILADFNAMMEQPQGWKFEPRFDANKEKMEAQKQIPTNRVNPAQAPSNQLMQVSNMQRHELVNPPRNQQRTASERMIDRSFDQIVEAQNIKLNDVASQDERAFKKAPDQDIVINIDKLKELRKYTNKDWLLVTKEQCVAILTEAHIDFSHIKNEKWELVKFIKSIVKDLDD